MQPVNCRLLLLFGTHGAAELSVPSRAYNIYLTKDLARYASLLTVAAGGLAAVESHACRMTEQLASIVLSNGHYHVSRTASCMHSLCFLVQEHRPVQQGRGERTQGQVRR
jgi:hypothetical protein